MASPADDAGAAALFAEVERIAHVGGFVWRPDQVPLWSAEFYRILGYEPGSVLPSFEAFLAAVHPDDVEKARRSYERALAGDIEDNEFRVVHEGTGEVRYVRGSGRVYREGGRVAHIVGALQDITEAKLRALELEEALAIARAVERAAGIGSFVVRVEPMEMVWTDGLEALTGLDAPNADAATHLDRVHPDDRQKQLRWWERLVREHSVEPLHVRMVCPDGTNRHLYTQATLMRLADGLERIVGTTLDITERVQLEDQLRHAEKMEAVGTLAAGVAHDFNNYLMVIDSSLSMLADGPEGSDRQELVDAGRLALSRCIELTRQLLAFARRQPFRPECVELTRVVENFRELLTRVVGSRASLEIENQGQPSRARVDPRHVERMLTNLVVNAADAIEETGTRTGRICVRVESLAVEAPRKAMPRDVPAGEYACVSVDDNGGGIDPARLPRIFDPYFTTKPVGRGTGLGLASVYGMARQNDGQVTVEDLEGGTRFRLWFPLAEAPPDAEERDPPPTLEPPRPSVPAVVLVVEDVDQVRNIAERILRHAGFKTLGARNGREALDLIERGTNVQMVLSDLQMPIMGGRELAEHLARRAGAPPIIFMTGYSEDCANMEPGVMLLAKPFTPDRLVDFVKRALAAYAVPERQHRPSEVVPKAHRGEGSGGA